MDIVYEDDHILVINKPPNLLSVPGKTESDCLETRAVDYNPNARLVHRLDRATSGLIIFGLGYENQVNLQRQFAARTVKKRYVAVAEGLLENDEGLIDKPLICDWPNRPLQIVCFENGKPSQTRYQVLNRDKEANTTRVALHPITGRSHQLRVHMLDLGHPLLGDEFYAPKDVLAKSERLLLHAEWLALQHPATGEAVEFLVEAEF